MSTANEHATEQNLLSRIKAQHEPGPMRSQLYSMLDKDGKQPSDLRLQWMFYAGMGDVAFRDLSNKAEEKAARKFITEGRFVPEAIENHYGQVIQRIKHFDDVNWGKTADGDIIMYDLSFNEFQPDWPDMVITLDERHAAALEALRNRMEYGTSIGKTWEDDPITLKDGTEITPILTNLDQIHLRMRQKNIAPSLK